MGYKKLSKGMMDFQNTDDERIKFYYTFNHSDDRYSTPQEKIEDEEIFRISSFEEIINALIGNLKIEFADLFESDPKTDEFSLRVAEKTSAYNLTPEKLKRREEYEKKLKEYEKEKYDYINTPGDTVSKFILRKEEEKKLHGAEVYGLVGMGKDTYSNLRHNKNKSPTFETCVQLMFAFKVTIDDANLLLKDAGRSFSNSKYHKLVEYYIKNKDYDFFKFNTELENLTGKTIGSLE